eukprot:NODE_3282_length_952_cov_3.426357_g2728_i0.p5 GENE.NODE_3282_length_952_cov_3.426357_g2728_i0~~NODE_3282_length_952_cov_3.426357_g2728_i0.p5  ORF type:complete len:73 (+),score=0.98 NODE_3282_length_952_cov_3.426357_g2728_i0:435-653(+)
MLTGQDQQQRSCWSWPLAGPTGLLALPATGVRKHAHADPRSGQGPDRDLRSGQKARSDPRSGLSGQIWAAQI